MEINKHSFSKKVVSQVVVQILMALRALIIIPILSKTLGSYYYGIWSQIIITITLLATVFTLRFDIVFVRFFSAEKEQQEVRDSFTTMLLTIFTVLTMAVIIILTFKQQVSVILFDEQNLTPFVTILIALLGLRSIFLYSLAYYRAKHQIIFYSSIQSVQIVGEILVLLVCIVFLKTTFLMALTYLVSFNAVLAFLVLLSVFLRIGPGKPSWHQLKPFLLFSLPLIPNVSLQWIINHSSRYFITHLIDLKSAGIYAASYSLAHIISFFITPIAFVLYPTISKLWDEQNIEEVKFWVATSIKYFLLFGIPAVIGIHLFSPFILKKLATAEFVQDNFLILFLAVGFLFLGVYQVYLYLIHLKEKTVLVLVVFIVIAIGNVIFNWVLIPVLGIEGAALASLMSYFTQAVLIFILSWKDFKIHPPWKFILKSIISSLIMFTVLRLFKISESWELFILVCAGALIYFISMLLLKGISEKEIKTIKNLLKF